MKKMKLIKIPVLILALSLMALPVLSCKSTTTSASTAATQTAAAQKGNISVDITGAGNLALSQVQDLAFEVAGTVEEVSVQAGDSVSKGEVLAKLDTTTWDNQVTTLERALTTAQRKVTTTQKTLADAQKAVTTTVTAKQLACVTSSVSLKNAQIALDKAMNTYTGPDVEMAQASVDKAKAYLEYAEGRRTDLGPSATWDAVVTMAQASLDSAQKTLNALLTNADSDQIWILKQQLIIAQNNYQNALDAVPQAQIDTADAVDNANIALSDALQSVADAQKALNDAKGKSPIITAPFDGFITKVNVAGGDEVLKGAIAVQLADPDKFEADILVSEMDIPQVKIGGQAAVSVSAMPGTTLSANVTNISPTATISSGVVNYKVRVEVQSLPTARTASDNSLSQFPGLSRLPGSSDNTSSSGNTSAQSRLRQSFASGQLSQTASSAAQNFKLKDGLTVTVTITVAQRTGVITVPNAAITTKAGQSYVQVPSPSGVNEQRAVQIGIKNWQYTEIISGLNEGEQIIVPKSAAPTATTSNTQIRPGAIPFIGGR
jgi:HlyD family secretion protein